MRREQLFAVLFFVAFCFLLYQFYRILSFFVGPLSYAALLAFICHSLYAPLLRALDYRESLDVPLAFPGGVRARSLSCDS
jgi:hypothetical protein